MKERTFYQYLVAIVVLALLATLGSFESHVSAIEDAQPTTTLLNAVTTGSAAIAENVGVRCKYTAVYVSWSAGTSAGVVTIETAHTSAYAGTWAPLTTVTWAAANTEAVYQLNGTYESIRTRVSTTVVGGTVTTYFTCN